MLLSMIDIEAEENLDGEVWICTTESHFPEMTLRS